jgi:hypothetical protein
VALLVRGSGALLLIGAYSAVNFVGILSHVGALLICRRFINGLGCVWQENSKIITISRNDN